MSYLYDQSQNGGASSGRLSGIVDTLGRTNRFTYGPNLSGRGTRQTFPKGRYIEFKISAANHRSYGSPVPAAGLGPTSFPVLERR